MAALSHTHESATLLAFPGMARDFSSGTIAAALRRHRLPERLTTQLLRATAGTSDARIALARALSACMHVEPLNLNTPNAILLTGAAGVGKSAVAAAIAAKARRETVLLNAREGLAQLRAGTLPRGKLVVMEAEGFTANPQEWWHFDYKDWHDYPIMNVTFEQVSATKGAH